MVRLSLAFRFILSSAVLFVCASPATAQLLSYDEIIASIPGKWSVPFELDGEQVQDCERFAMNIWLREENGAVVYYSQASGSDVDITSEPDRSLVRHAPGEDGQPIPALLIQYDGEDRVTDDGAKVSWRLYMPDRDAFTWQATHWGWSGSTPFRHRCSDERADS